MYTDLSDPMAVKIEVLELENKILKLEVEKWQIQCTLQDDSTHTIHNTLDGMREHHPEYCNTCALTLKLYEIYKEVEGLQESLSDFKITKDIKD